jgi:hypothetical protein
MALLRKLLIFIKKSRYFVSPRLKANHEEALIFLLTLLSSSSLVFGQPSNLDSLWSVWNDQTQPDTNRLKAMKKIAWDGYLFSQPDSAFYFAQMRYDLAEKTGWKKQMAGALNTQGISFFLRGDHPQALNHYQRSLTIRDEIGDKKRNCCFPESYWVDI